MVKLTKREIADAISKIIQYTTENGINPSEFDTDARHKTFKQFIYDKKVDEVINDLLNKPVKEYFVEMIVFATDEQDTFSGNKLILEWEQYKNIPKTNFNYRYDTGNTNTKTSDHIHVFSKNNQIYAINIDGTPHDGSKARLGSKEVKFLKSIGFTPPANGLLEWITLDSAQEYTAINIDLLFD